MVLDFLGFIAVLIVIAGYVVARHYLQLGFVPLGFGLAFLIFALSAPLSPVAIDPIGKVFLYGIGISFTLMAIVWFITERRANRK